MATRSKDLHPRASAVLSWWIGPELVAGVAAGAAAGAAAAAAAWPAAKAPLWWRGGPAVDAEVISSFGADLKALAAGEYDGWGDPAGGNPLNTLAGIVLGDQFSRNAYRGTAQAFALDSKALSWSLALLESGAADKWPLSFKRCVALFDAEVQRAKEGGAGEETVQAAESFAGFARRHRDVVQKWGRFPHRNALLGRESTPEEAAGLADGSIEKF